jgi:colicin import membrane protein
MAAADRNDHQTRAQAVFTASEQRDKSVRAEIEKERAATDAKTARLKALRLAREAEEAAHAAANPKPASAKGKAAKKKA